MLRLLSAVWVSTALLGCVRDNPDSRLDSDQGVDPRELAAMLKLDCSQRREEVLAARDESQTDSDRIASYRLALKAFDGGAGKIEAAFTKEPDLLYLAEADALRLRLQRCQAQSKTFTDELRKFELSVQFKPSFRETEAHAEPRPAPTPTSAAPAKAVRATVKKAKTPKSAVAKRKKLGRPHAVLADASN